MLNLRPDRQIPRVVIALGFVYMYHYMSRFCVKKRNNASTLLDRRGTIRSSTYYTTLKGVFENGETVDWEEVQRVQTNHVRQQLTPGGYVGAYGLPAMSSCYQPKYQDGEYVSGSDED
ncbi:hypothetical protein K492DRAFT_173331 [Lichtheimia hyalospora FSU 10163]|nr:hypothetical protein K492DRAFT_173331 [Lichtheimia hyalospora FSU 10163]